MDSFGAFKFAAEAFSFLSGLQHLLVTITLYLSVMLQALLHSADSPKNINETCNRSMSGTLRLPDAASVPRYAVNERRVTFQTKRKRSYIRSLLITVVIDELSKYQMKWRN